MGLRMMKFETNDDISRLIPGIKGLLVGASVAAMAVTSAYAQTTPSDVETVDEEEAEEDDDDDTVVVTGSRIRKDTFSSIKPLQVITSEQSLDVGLIDPSTILQRSEAASGQQVDATFQGFVLANGPGSQTLSLRGLGANRTLILINGRRYAPTGVEGAPSLPSLNLIPGSLVERYDLLLDGASSVYGSDAVAGVANVILRKDFEGFEVFASGDYNEQGAGNDYTFSGSWGKNTDRGFFGIGAEFDHRDEITKDDRDFLAGCNTHYELTDEGTIRQQNLATKLDIEDLTDGALTARTGACKGNRFTGITEVSGGVNYGSFFFTPGFSNTGIPNFSDTFLLGVPLDGDSDGVQDVYFPDVTDNGNDGQASVVAGQDRFSAMAYGEYTFEGTWNITPFFEALYTHVDSESNSGGFQVFPFVPASNPFNICNPDAPGGVDCGLAQQSVQLSDRYQELETIIFGGPGGVASATGAVPTRPVFIIDGDRVVTDITLEQQRFVGGLRGDMPYMNDVFTLQDWSFEFSAVWSEGTGKSIREGIREDRLALGLGLDPSVLFAIPITSSSILSRELPDGPCATDPSNFFNPDAVTPAVADGCVPINLFANSVYDGVIGNFETEAEREYLFDDRRLDTVYTQTLFQLFFTGQVVELPAGPLSTALGVEYRIDEIDSIPNDVASEGLLFGFFADQGAVGEKWIQEAFFEFDVPIMAAKPLVEDLTVNASARWTEEEFYGSAWTYAVEAGYRPVSSLLFKGSFGTSFRAPNLRENFLIGTTGFNTLGDPCVPSEDQLEFSPTDDTFTYDANLGDGEQRAPEVLANCLAEGRDPTSVGVDGVNETAFGSYSVEVARTGTFDLEPETSESLTMGVAFEQPWFDAFDLNLNLNYYDIEIENTVIEPSSAFIVSDCYFNDNGGRSPFCNRITTDPADLGRISFIDGGFINRDKETAVGLDYNINFRTEFEAMDLPMDLSVNLRANQLTERNTIQSERDDNGDLTTNTEEFAGETFFPEWTGTGTVSLAVEDVLFTWQARYIGEVDQDANGIDPFDDALGSQGTGFFGDTCGGPTVGDVLCRDVGFAEAWTEHTASVRFRGNDWTLRAGITNIFDKAPPLADSNEVPTILGNTNVYRGASYNINGREFFMTFSKDFN